MLMRVKGRPDVIANTDVSVAENDTPMKIDCVALSKRFADTEEYAEEMELVLTHYCRSRGAEYATDQGWAELLAPLMVNVTRQLRFLSVCTNQCVCIQRR